MSAADLSRARHLHRHAIERARFQRSIASGKVQAWPNGRPVHPWERRWAADRAAYWLDVEARDARELVRIAKGAA